MKIAGSAENRWEDQWAALTKAREGERTAKSHAEKESPLEKRKQAEVRYGRRERGNDFEVIFQIFFQK